MPTLTIDNKTVTVPEGATILEAARKLGIEIPTLCFLEGYAPETTCMVCVVKVNGGARLLPSCATKAAEGMVVESDSEEVLAARRTALELLFSDHLGDCVGPCQQVCPAHMDIPRMLAHIAAGRWREAVVTVKAHIPLPAILGRICPELCEKGCRRAQADASVSICRLKRMVGDTDLASAQPYLPPCTPATGKQVAIVGAGPAGLTAAWFLLREGHNVTIYDANPTAGGMLHTPELQDKLPASVIAAEVALIAKLGAKFRQGDHVGRAELAKLRQEFDAVLLATGEMNAEAAAAFDLPLAGKGLPVDRNTNMTTHAGLFAAGAAVAPSKHAVRAVADGHAAAQAITLYLAGKPISIRRHPYSVHIGKLNSDELAQFLARASSAPRSDVITEDADARAEAARCLHCECLKQENCALRDAGEAYHADPSRFKGERRAYQTEETHPDILFEGGKCIACGRCVTLTREAGEPLGLTFAGRGFTVRTAVPFQATLREGVQHSAAAIADACPTAALSRKGETG